MTEINCEKILEKYFPLVIADEDEWAIQCVKAMKDACEQTKNACIIEADTKFRHNNIFGDDYVIDENSIKQNVIIK